MTTEAVKALARPALRYYGGKWKLGGWIASQFPPHDCYVEPYGGGASVLLQKSPALHEVYNDLDLAVVSFFRVLRERPGALQRVLRHTPFSRAELDTACRPADAGVDELELARRLFIRSWQGHHGLPAQGQMGWRFERSRTRSKTTVDDWCAVIEQIEAVANRLRRVQIECDHALRVITRFDTPQTVVYVDPPYPQATRSERWRMSAYNHELTDDDHRKLAWVLSGIKGMAIVSGAPCALYDELYAGWQRVSRRQVTQARTTATECLWLSPRTAERTPARQLALEVAE